MRFIDAVRAQGDGLRASRAAVSGRLAEIDLAPWRGRPLVLTGMGASSNAIAAALPGYWAAGLHGVGRSGSELLLASADDAEAVVAVSQGGRSAEVYAAMQALPKDCPRLALTDVPDSPIGTLADAILPLALLEDSNVRTIGYTGTVQALLLLRDQIAGTPQSPGWDQIADEVDRLTVQALQLAEHLPEHLRQAQAFDVVGSGVHVGTALQGALLLREVAKLPAAAYETYQYLHGPVEAAGPGRALILIGGAREVKLAEELTDVGAHVLLVTDQAGQAGQAETTAETVFKIPAAGEKAGILAVLPVQTIAHRLAEDNAVPDGVFRYHQDDTKVV
jgi:glutamine---fructose-6-phosphate transaminase (isomerizing)